MYLPVFYCIGMIGCFIQKWIFLSYFFFFLFWEGSYCILLHTDLVRSKRFLQEKCLALFAPLFRKSGKKHVQFELPYLSGCFGWFSTLSFPFTGGTGVHFRRILYWAVTNCLINYCCLFSLQGLMVGNF